MDMQFDSITEIKQSILLGKEVCFDYQEKSYGIFWLKQKLFLTEGENEVSFTDLDALLDYMLHGEKLKDVLMKAEITWRNI